MLKEFKEFISKGNALDLAIGVIIGGAFGLIVTSIVADILMPIIGIIMGGIDFSGLSINVGNAEILYGKFIQAAINFLIIAFVLFMIIKTINSFRDKKEEEPTT
ncbi:MAG: large conductance mechanosensitive channel protein MscL, partial [Ignavibacteria bacterium]|nr:large conductance mechanosensitive channel protein MscL [Ignavibacteria bacterium]